MAADRDVLDPQELEAVPGQFVAISRARFRLAVYRRRKLGRSYAKAFGCRIAVGAVGFTTPAGPFFVLAKASNPDWLMPNSKWVPKELRGTTVPGGHPDNPIKVSFLKLTEDGVGIHGTDNLLSLRSRASHGCVRVAPESALWLYRNVAVGSPVYVT